MTPKKSRKTVEISIAGNLWQVPYGFGKAYKEAHLQKQTAKDISRLLALVAVPVQPEEIISWPYKKRLEAFVWASNVILVGLNEGLRPVRQHPCPASFRKYAGVSRGV